MIHGFGKIIKQARLGKNFNTILKRSNLFIEEGILAHNPEMPLDGTCIDIRVAIYKKMGLKRKGAGRPPKNN